MHEAGVPDVKAGTDQRRMAMLVERDVGIEPQFVECAHMAAFEREGCIIIDMEDPNDRDAFGTCPVDQCLLALKIERPPPHPSTASGERTPGHR
jgi:hypothetical protein